MTQRIGMNLQSAGTLYWVNMIHGAPFWNTTDADEWNLNTDPDGAPISVSIGRNGSALSTAGAFSIINRGSGDEYLYPGGTNSWTLSWDGIGTWAFARDITTPLTTSSSPQLLTVVPSNTAGGSGEGGMSFGLTSTGSSATVTMSAGTSVGWTAHGFPAGTPVAFQAGTSVDTAITKNTVYYVVSPATNSFSIAATVGGTPISLNGNSVGTITGFGNWARNLKLYQSSQASNIAAGEIWNPDYIRLFKHHFSPLRFMQLVNTMNENSFELSITYSGFDISYTPISRFSVTPLRTVMWDALSTNLPSGISLETVYYVIEDGFVAGSSFRISTSPTGAAINLTGGSGTGSIAFFCVLTNEDVSQSTSLFWGGRSFNAEGQYAKVGGPSIEALCDLCNIFDADMYLNIPPLARDSWATDVATKVQAHLNPQLSIYLEMSNEVWLGTSPNASIGWPNRGDALFPTAGGATVQAGFLYGMNYRAINIGHIFRTILSNPNRVISVAGGQAGNSGFASPSAGYLSHLPTDFGGPSFWYGSENGYAFQYFQYICEGGYFVATVSLPFYPDAWTADADYGVEKWYQQTAFGNILPTTASTPLVVTGASTSSHYIVTGAGVGSGTPPNGTILYINFNSITNAAGADLAVDGGSAFPLQNAVGGAIGAAEIPNSWNGGFTLVFVFTSAVNPSWGTVPTPGWRQQDRGYPGGAFQQVMDNWNADFAAYQSGPLAQPTNLKILSYECGQGWFEGNAIAAADPNQINYLRYVQISSRMYDAYKLFFPMFHANHIDIACHYADVVSNLAGQSWGSMLALAQPPHAAAKYQALIDLNDPSLLGISFSSIPNESGVFRTQPRKIPHA